MFRLEICCDLEIRVQVTVMRVLTLCLTVCLLSRVVSELQRENKQFCHISLIVRQNFPTTLNGETRKWGCRTEGSTGFTIGLVTYTHFHFRRVNVFSGIVTGVECIKSNEQLSTLLCT